MQSPKSRLEKGDLVLVTGANGYIGSHVADLLLSKGLRVRGTLRQAKPFLDDYFDQKYGKSNFEAVLVPRLNDSAIWHQALEGVSGIIHIAADTTGNPDFSEVVSNSVEGVASLLLAASQATGIRSFVYTSTVNAAKQPSFHSERVEISQATWNDQTLASLSKGSPSSAAQATAVYSISKTKAEQAVWKFAEERNPSFAVNTVLPAFNTGPILIPGCSGSTMSFTKMLLDKNGLAMEYFPPEWFVDVRDCARLHVAALLDDSVDRERLFATAAPFNWTDVHAILSKLRPHADLLAPPVNEAQDLTSFHMVAQRAEGLLKSNFGLPHWTSLDDSIAAGIL